MLHNVLFYLLHTIVLCNVKRGCYMTSFSVMTSYEVHVYAHMYGGIDLSPLQEAVAMFSSLLFKGNCSDAFNRKTYRH